MTLLRTLTDEQRAVLHKALGQALILFSKGLMFVEMDGGMTATEYAKFLSILTARLMIDTALRAERSYPDPVDPEDSLDTMEHIRGMEEDDKEDSWAKAVEKADEILNQVFYPDEEYTAECEYCPEKEHCAIWMEAHGQAVPPQDAQQLDEDEGWGDEDPGVPASFEDFLRELLDER